MLNAHKLVLGPLSFPKAREEDLKINEKVNLYFDEVCTQNWHIILTRYF